MTPRERVRRYGMLVSTGVVVIWTLLCFLVAISPRLREIGKVNGDLVTSSQQLKDMRREIEDAGIVGGPPVGASRFDKFGILARDEEQLFLTDLISFCKDTDNVLNLVRRSEYAQRAPSTEEQVQGGTRGTGSQPASQPAAEQAVQAVIERVPHTVTFSGTFLSAFYLLRRLESYKRLLTVERVDLVTDNRLGYPRLNGNVTIDLYLATTSATAPAGPEKTPGAAPAQPQGRGPRMEGVPAAPRTGA
jgi:hypothetical protein